MDPASNPGSATPETLYRIYRDRAAATANPFVLRDMQSSAGLSFAATVGHGAAPHPHAHAHAQAHAHARPDRAAEAAAERESLLQQRAILAPMPTMRPAHAAGGGGGLGERRRADSPPRGHFRVITHCGASAGGGLRAAAQQQPPTSLPPRAPHGARTGLQLTLHSLDMSKR